MEGYYNEKEIRIALQKEHDEILTEEITKDVTKKVTKNVTEEVTKNVTESVSKSTREEALRQHVLDLKRNGFDAETIASFFNEPLDAVKAIWESC